MAGGLNPRCGFVAEIEVFLKARNLKIAKDASGTGSGVRILGLAVWFGIVTGLLEGSLFLLLQQFGRMTYVSVEIVWIAALFNLFLFLWVGLVLLILSLVIPRWPWTAIAIFFFTTLALVDWLGLILFEHISPWAVVLLAIGLAARVASWAGKHEAAVFGFWRRSIAWVALVAVIAFVTIQTSVFAQDRLAVTRLPDAQHSSPNIVLIVLDTLRADHLSSYGYPRVTSPNIDQLADQGVLFENAYAASSWSLPSHASLFTGRSVHEHGADWSTPRAMMDNGLPTIAEALSDRGYHTAGFSSNLFWVTSEVGLDRGFAHFEDFFTSPADMMFRTFYGRTFEKLVLTRLGFEDIPARIRASDMNQSILQWVEDNSTANGDGPKRPFFIFANYMDTHDPYLPPDPFRNKFSQVENPGGLINDRIGQGNPELTSDQVQTEMDAYDGSIAYVDDAIGELLQGLDERGQAENTLVIITSDHGEAFGDHGVFLHKNSLYREEIRVPLIMWQPDKLPAGMRVTQAVSNVSLPATLMDFVFPEERLFRGPSLSELITAAQTGTSAKGMDWPVPLSEMAQIPWAPQRAPASSGDLKSLIGTRWHYIEHEANGPELYDLATDTAETNNLAGQPELQDVLAPLEDCLSQTLDPTHLSCPGELTSLPN